MLSRAELQQLLDRMAAAYRAGDAKGCADLFAPDAQLHSPFGVARGYDDLIRLHREWTSAPNAKRFSILDCGSHDGIAWCLCRFTEENETEDGTSLLVLEQDTAGAWLIRSCCLYGDTESA